MHARTDLLRVSILVVSMLVTLSSGCDRAGTELESQPLPVLLDLTPDTVLTAGTGTSITLLGSGFTTVSRVRWNGEDRETEQVNGSQLRMQLRAEDVQETGTGRVEVVNPPPGGGTSGALTEWIRNPPPIVISVTPSTILRGDTSAIVVRGSGFVAGASVLLSGGSVSTTFISDTELIARQSSSFPPAAGAQQLRVSNPGPGGGISAPFDVTVQNPVAVIAALNPDSVATDQGSFTVIVSGTRFVSGATVRWNGADRVTAYVNSTRLTAQILATDVANPGDFSVVVANPTAAVSNARNVRVVQAPPRITQLTPGLIAAGNSEFTLLVAGRNFTAASVVQWNGQARPSTFMSTTSISAQISSSDILTAGTAQVTVRDPATTLTSSPQAFVILAPPTIISQQVIELAANDIVYDSVSRRIYASIPGNASTNPNSIAIIDPNNTSLVDVIPGVGSNPGRLAISDDGRFLYTGLLGASRIARIDLNTRSKDLDIDIGADPHLGAQLVEDILVLKGAPRTVIASLRNTCCSPRHQGVFIWDDGVRRAGGTQGHTGSNRITAGPTPKMIFGYNNETTEFGFRRILVLPDGLQEDLVRGGVVSGFGPDIESEGWFAYSTSGDLIDLATVTRAGTFPVSGLVSPDARKGRVHFFNSGTLRTYHPSSLSPIGTVAIPAANGASVMVRWGTDGLAFRTATQIVLIRSTLIGP